MTPETIIPLILTTAAAISDLVVKRKSVALGRKHEVSELLARIGKTLERVACEFREGNIPHGACSEMEHYSREIQEVLGGIIPTEKLLYYSAVLQNANNIEMMLMATRDENHIIQLEKAAGIFNSSAILVKI